jgi:hypothetical protein
MFDTISSAAGAVVDAVTSAAGALAEAPGSIYGGIRDISYGMPAEKAFVKRMVMSGMTDADALAQMVYALRYPETALRRLDPKDPADKDRIKEWNKLKKELVEPSIRRYKPITELTASQKEKRIRMATSQATKGGNADARSAMADDIKRMTGHGAEAWFGNHRSDATFLGRPIRASKGSSVGGVHQTMLDKLNKAEENLAKMSQFAGLSGIDLADAVGLVGLGGLRPPLPATGGKRPSLHCYGLAVDINAKGNPFVGLNGTAVPDLVARATRLMRGEPFKITRPPKTAGRDVMEQWVATHLASEDVITYLNMDKATLEFQIGEMLRMGTDVPAKMRKLSWWKARQKEDRALRGKKDFVGGRDPRKMGIMNLDEHLVKALTDAGLTWGGMFKGAKDLMHFDDRSLFRKKKAGS